MHAAVLALALALALASAACTSEIAPLGEVIVVVDTDLPVPAAAGRLRLDLYSEDGTWYESRDIALREPSDWPASFGLVAADGVERRVLVRLRAYPERKVRDYHGERFLSGDPYEPPAVARSRSELCASPPELPVGGTLTLRVGRDPFIGQLSGGNCPAWATAVGSTAAVVEIAQPGSYRFGVLATTPADSQVTIQLRGACDDDASAVACETGVLSEDPFILHEPAGFTVDLDPGLYHLVTAGLEFTDSPTDIVVGVAETAAWPPSAPPSQSVPAEPLLKGDANLTPPTEPEPLVTVDQLLLVHIVPEKLLSTRTTLRGACLGKMAQLAASWPHQQPVLGEAATCTSTPGARDAVHEAPLEPVSEVGASVQGTFPAPEPCERGTAGAAVVCVPGGFFVLGGTETATGDELDTVPERSAVMRRFWIDRREVTVARFRDALARGFNPGLDRPFPNDAELPGTIDDPLATAWCTWSTSPMGREEMPLSCISWYGARAFCGFFGGDLPTEAQWEYVATAAGRDYETTWPWGSDAPQCECDGTTSPCHRATIGRSDFEVAGDVGDCWDGSVTTIGPLPAAAAEGDHGDETPPLDGVNGVVGLVGGVREWTRDASRRYDHPCWSAASVFDPACLEDEAPLRVQRGGNWIMDVEASWATQRWSDRPLPVSPMSGFRCVYPSPLSP